MSYELSGNLPPDAAIDSTGNFTCTLTHVPTCFKVYDFDVKATDSAGQIDLRHVIVDAPWCIPIRSIMARRSSFGVSPPPGRTSLGP